MTVKFIFCSHTNVLLTLKQRRNFVAHIHVWKPHWFWQFMPVQLLLHWELVCRSLELSIPKSWALFSCLNCSAVSWELYVTDESQHVTKAAWRKEQYTMESLLKRQVFFTTFSSLYTKLNSDTWTLGPRRQLNAVEVYRAILKICNFIVFLNYRGKVEIITKVLKNAKG